MLREATVGLLRLVARQDVPEAGENTVTVDCDSGNGYDGRMGVRISAIFVILVGSLLGAWFPVFAKRHRGVGVPEWAFFIAKYFGSGVIIATAFIHLLAPGVEALSSPCLSGPITDYSWPEGIVLMTIVVLFFVELMTMRYAKFGQSHDDHDHEAGQPHSHDLEDLPPTKKYHDDADSVAHSKAGGAVFGDEEHAGSSRANGGRTASHVRGEDHLGHSRDHHDNDAANEAWAEPRSEKGVEVTHTESYAAQMTAIFILEFGVIFHSIFIGLTLAVAGDEFTTLYIVLVFHQTFEGLGLGTRLASADWPKSKRLTPYFLGAGYAVSTPIAIAVGLGVRESFAPGSNTTLIANGVFDSISAGILIYTGLVELMAHEFMFSPFMQRASIRTVLSAFAMLCLGAGLMALLGKWA
ncbi:hypothetical protein MBLNU457_4590t1 [Dothideomycetes sp. NU457]